MGRSCEQQKRLEAALPKLVVTHGVFQAFSDGYFHILWRVQGCQHHKNVRPCGNKQERGVPFGADCNACPLEAEVSKFVNG